MVIPATGYFCYLQAKKIAESQMQQYALGTAAQISKRVESFLSHHTYNVQLIKAFFENNLIDHLNDKQILQYFHLFRKDHPEFVNINFGDETGRFLMAPAQIPEVHKVFDPRIRPWYRGAIKDKGSHWTDVYLFASTQKPGMTVSVPIYDKTSALKAVCGIDIDISSFSRFLKGMQIGNNGFAYIFENRKGRVIAHPGLVQLPWDRLHIDLLRTCLNDLKSKKQDFGMSSFRGEKFFTAYTDYPANNWTVGVTLPVSDFLENIKSIKKAIVTLVIAGIFLSSILSYLIAMTIVKPLNELKDAIERISNGDLEHRVKIRDPDIASTLAGSFNKMAASLEYSSIELERTYAELAQKDKLAAVGQMTASIAHEIKNPLGIISGSAQVITNAERPIEMKQKAAQFIMDEVERLNQTLTSFLEFAKPAKPDFKKINMVNILEEILVSTQGLYEQKKYTINRTFPEKVPDITADSNQIKEVLWNVFLNAVQSMPKGGIVTFKISIEKADSRVVDSAAPIKPMIRKPPDFLAVSITDQGCGITPSQMDRLMDPFVSFKDNGIGLGLSIVSQIMQTHNGHIIIDSQEKKGTTIKLLFPMLSQEI